MEETQKTVKACSVLILAAGKSSRMRLPKFSLKFNKRTTFLEKIISCYSNFGCQEIIVVLNEKGVNYIQSQSIELMNNCTIIKNSNVAWERFYSVKLGLKALKTSTPTFIHNVDNPYAITKTLIKLFEGIGKSDYIVPTYENRGGHPILLSKKVINDLIKEEKNDLILSNFLKKYDKKILAVTDSTVLVNINTIEEYNKFFN